MLIDFLKPTHDEMCVSNYNFQQDDAMNYTNVKDCIIFKKISRMDSHKTLTLKWVPKSCDKDFFFGASWRHFYSNNSQTVQALRENIVHKIRLQLCEKVIESLFTGFIFDTQMEATVSIFSHKFSIF